MRSAAVLHSPSLTAANNGSHVFTNERAKEAISSAGKQNHICG